MRILFLVLILVFPAGIMLFELTPDGGDQGRTYLENSAPYIGTDVPREDGIDGTGITVAVIDTGVDFNHPDLAGWGKDGKVVGGHNFIQGDMPPLDTSGHGTQVAGIIAADGELVGIAPKARILAYKVSEDGEGVSSDLIVRAIGMAVEDGADIINISLGVNSTNTKIDRAVNQAVENGVLVVVAAGNGRAGARNHRKSRREHQCADCRGHIQQHHDKSCRDTGDRRGTVYRGSDGWLSHS